MTNSLLSNMAMEIVDLYLLTYGDFPVRKLLVYQRVYKIIPWVGFTLGNFEIDISPEDDTINFTKNLRSGFVKQKKVFFMLLILSSFFLADLGLFSPFFWPIFGMNIHNY